jgi:hypothetical protein
VIDGAELADDGPANRITQPTFADIWIDLSEEDRMRIFPLLKGDDRQAVLDVTRTAFDEAAREQQLKEKAAEALFFRDVRRLADQLEAERAGAADSWAPQPIADLFDTEQQEPEIGEWTAEDGTSTGGIFYRGKVNEVHGPSESGKTMWVLAVAAQEIRAGRHVVMVDYEDDGRAIVNRLRYVFELERGEIEKYFHYFRPDAPFTDAAFEHITGIGEVSLAIIDAVTESMAVSQLDGRNENEVATWYNEFPKRLAKEGMGVVVIDHTPQDNATRQIGSQHKKSAVDGVSYTAEPVYPFVKGQLGHLRIRVAKDKIGSIRQAALPQGEGKQFWRGDFTIDGRPATTGPRVLMTGVGPTGPVTPDTGQRAYDVKESTVTLPTPGEAVVLEILAEDTGWLSNDTIMRWHNEQFDDPKDPRRFARTAPRKRAVKLIEKGLVERRDSGGSVQYRITPMGHHAMNVFANQRQEGAQQSLEIEGFKQASEPKGEPKGEPE